MSPISLPSLIVFGPQTPLPSAEYLSQMRSVLLNDRRLATFLAAIKDLPNLWPSLVGADASLVPVPGSQLLEGFRKWIDQGGFPTQRSDTLPNILSTPLTIIIHIVEYFNYLKHLVPSVSHSQILEGVQAGGIQGFCTGFLAAFALGCSKDEEDVCELAAVALRLAVCVGAYVDLDCRFANPPREISCLTVRWTSEAGKDALLDTLKDYSDVCTSRLYLVRSELSY